MSYDFFISYSRKNKDFAIEVEGFLKAKDYVVWRDERNIDGGDHYPSELQKSLQASQGMVLILSPDSEASTWVGAEVKVALDEKMPIIPIMFETIDYEEAFDRKIRGIQYLAKGDWDGLETAAAKRLLDTFRIASNVDTQFLRSTPHTIPPGPSVVASSRYWPEFDNPLKHAQKIAASDTVTNDEAEFGGRYFFEHSFDLLCNPSMVRRAVLHVWADDECEIALNGRSIGRWTFNRQSNDPLSQSANILSGNFDAHNIFNIEVENWSWLRIGGQGLPNGANNPYGIAFTLEVTYVKDRKSPSSSLSSKPATIMLPKELPFNLELGPARPTASVQQLHVNCRLFLSEDSVRIRSGSVKVLSSDGALKNLEDLTLDSIKDNFPMRPIHSPLFRLNDDSQVWISYRGNIGTVEQDALARTTYDLIFYFTTDHGQVVIGPLNISNDLAR